MGITGSERIDCGVITGDVCEFPVLYKCEFLQVMMPVVTKTGISLVKKHTTDFLP